MDLFLEFLLGLLYPQMYPFTDTYKHYKYGFGESPGTECSAARVVQSSVRGPVGEAANEVPKVSEANSTKPLNEPWRGCYYTL